VYKKSCKSQCIIFRQLTETTWHVRKTDFRLVHISTTSRIAPSTNPEERGRGPAATRYFSTDTEFQCTRLVHDLTRPAGPSLDSMIISCMSRTEKAVLATRTFSCLERFLTETDQTVQKIVTIESFTDSCEQFTDGYVLLRAVYDCYELFYESFTEKSNRGHLWEDFWHVKKLSLPSRILTSACEMCRTIYG